MATRRRGSSSPEDLRARLGIETAPEPEVAADGSGEVEAGEGGVPVNVPDEVPVSDLPPMGGYANEDYAATVAEAEDAPIEATQNDWRSAHDTGGVQDNKKTRILLIAALIALLVGIGIGSAVGHVTAANSVVKKQIGQAQALEDPVGKTAKKLAALDADLDTISLDPKSKSFEKSMQEFNNRLSEDLTGPNKIKMSATVLDGHSMVLADKEAGPRLTELVAAVSALESLVKQHEGLTAADRNTVKREIEGTQDDAQYAVIFNAAESRKRLSAYMDDPEEATFEPVAGVRITLPDHLDVITQNDDYFYKVTLPNGSETTVPIYTVVTLPRNQLIQSAANVTATQRYMQRAAKLKEAVAETARIAKKTQEAVEAAAQR